MLWNADFQAPRAYLGCLSNGLWNQLKCKGLGTPVRNYLLALLLSFFVPSFLCMFLLSSSPAFFYIFVTDFLDQITGVRSPPHTCLALSGGSPDERIWKKEILPSACFRVCCQFLLCCCSHIPSSVLEATTQDSDTNSNPSPGLCRPSALGWDS